MTVSELKLLYCYYRAHGSCHYIIGTGGQIVDAWAEGTNHAQVAQMMGIRGPKPHITARKRLVRLQRKLHGKARDIS